MTILAKDSGGRDFKPVPAGPHLALCTMVADIGMQEGYNGKPQRKVYVRFEIPDERVSFERDGQPIEGPAIIGKMYTLSLSEKANLRRDLENWRGKAFTPEELKGFDISKLLGKPCQIGVTHDTKDGKTYANISGVMGLSKDQKGRAATLVPENPLIEFTVDDIDRAVYESLPKWIRERVDARMQESEVATTLERRVDDEFSDDIPF